MNNVGNIRVMELDSFKRFIMLPSFLIEHSMVPSNSYCKNFMQQNGHNECSKVVYDNALYQSSCLQDALCANLPTRTHEQTLMTFLNESLNQIRAKIARDCQAIIGVTIFRHGRPGFLTFGKVEETSNAIALDGVRFGARPNLPSYPRRSIDRSRPSLPRQIRERASGNWSSFRWVDALSHPAGGFAGSRCCSLRSTPEGVAGLRPVVPLHEI
ncbi:hypothetical protein DM860_011810 [Cuscuta australis]|uniref:RRM domain-containing protein n=1 Tax=Cuscuta australis TaxID=267555 RepID=A0A328DKE2_9ASTE|nr:hypothetical protein DM860_011810 [Cuscuta australis]